MGNWGKIYDILQKTLILKNSFVFFVDCSILISAISYFVNLKCVLNGLNLFPGS